MIEKTIEVTQRACDFWIDDRGFSQPKYHAQLKDTTGVWGRGKTPSEAIGDLIDAHPEQFNLSIIYLGNQSR